MQDNMDVQFMKGYHPTDTEPEKRPVLSEGEEILDMSEDFDFGDFQVVRREFFAHLREPSISFNNSVTSFFTISFLFIQAILYR